MTDGVLQKSTGVPDSAAVALRLSHISKHFGGTAALKDVTFSATAGEVHALLGENGAGKSTLMAIAAGDVRPDRGTVAIGGEVTERLTSNHALRLGFAIVHQHPAVLPDLTVAENLVLAVPPDLRRERTRDMDWVASQLERVGCVMHPRTRMADVGVAQRQLVELAKALAVEPKVLVLDEPTAPLTADLVELLFDKIRLTAERGAAVVYISHRLQEIRQIAHTVTVMRDGEVRGSGPIAEMSDEEMLKLIVGRTVTNVFPAKGAGPSPGKDTLVVRGLSGTAFHDISITAHSGEIVGLAGISGNGQTEFLRSLAGMLPASGEVLIGGRSLRLSHPKAAYKAGIVFLSSDRQSEGLFTSLSVRENAAFSALPRFAKMGIMQRRVEQREVWEQGVELAVRAPSIEANVSRLSGGNQQKIILARALLAKAAVVLAEEPTAGVDVGARSEIYRILRNMANDGTPLVIVSSDMQELSGLCDRVFVVSRGHLVRELAGGDVTEQNIGHAIVTATYLRRRDTERKEARQNKWLEWRARVRHFVRGDYAPSVVLALLILVLGAAASDYNVRFVSSFNIHNILLLTTALAFIGFGQLCVILTGGIDVSVGPLAGLTVVIASFFLLNSSSNVLVVVGILAMFAAGATIGIANGLLVRFGKITAVAATLGAYIIIQGISILLRPQPGGNISEKIIAAIQTTAYGVPVAFLVAAVLAVTLEIALRYTRWGLSLRAVGSNEESAARIGVRTDRAVILAFVACCLLTVLGGVMLCAQLGIGDPTQGIGYTLTSIAAVVIGGASLTGGRGAFVGVLFGAALVQEINAATSFLGLSDGWKYWFIGFLTLGAVAVYSQTRREMALS